MARVSLRTSAPVWVRESPAVLRVDWPLARELSPARRLAHHFLDSDRREGSAPPAANAPVDNPPVDNPDNGDMGGSDFGVPDDDSWDDDSGSVGGDVGGDDGGGGDDWT